MTSFNHLSNDIISHGRLHAEASGMCCKYMTQISKQ